MNIAKGFYPALGTPLNADGNLMEESYRKQIECMISAGTSGMLSMGSMGVEAALSTATYIKTAEVAADTVKGRVPLFIGAMDNSVFRVKERFEMLKGLSFDGVVLTAPFYGKSSEKDAMQFFQKAADEAPKPVYLYDLPSATQFKITYDMVCELAKHPNIKGIKTADTAMIKKIMFSMPDFHVLYSNLDIFDVGLASGFPCFLDGMFTCTPENSANFVKAQEKGDIAKASECIKNIVDLRDLFFENNLWAGYTVAMNLLGFEGNYGTGYCDITPLPGEVQRVKDMMVQIGELS